MSPLDLQVNGYAGTDFNRDGLTAEALHHACECLVEDGCDSILATFITDSIDAMSERMSRLVELREQDSLAQKVIAGIHIEGPFTNPEKGYVGAHPPQHVKPATLEDAKRLLDAAGGLTKIVTLAPEFDQKFHTTEFLANNGVTVSAGHCNPSLEVLRASTEHGLSMFTHVGNGCPMTMHRHDNIIQRALSLRDKLWLCFIPDGVHIEFFALVNYLRTAGLEKTIFVTDAISASRLGPGKYTLAGWDIVIGEDLVARSPDGSHFVGSTVTIPRILTNGQQHLGLSKAELQLLLDTNPRKAVGLT
ncbi:N-acetylglucosamine-6-phosphate deacetylase [Brevifollis gellanilyticus]|uniref:N-acetylglucosamine-6-phosphate deacetylase n=1 Tax=Brevifollis gellanilyticus TaxID=748831 RepID=A0A512M9C2_9BACT|nr:N-acetylglucosamine-6-phosphate deacetylase [Brevifollis gellanilyticus]GEP43348.1 N-acetylglucosamine-6-phosphate deacetylase [Brevifollis gellanilyticus]